MHSQLSVLFQIIEKAGGIPWDSIQLPEGRNRKSVQNMIDKEKAKIKKAREAGVNGESTETAPKAKVSKEKLPFYRSISWLTYELCRAREVPQPTTMMTSRRRRRRRSRQRRVARRLPRLPRKNPTMLLTRICSKLSRRRLRGLFTAIQRQTIILKRGICARESLQGATHLFLIFIPASCSLVLWQV